VKVTVLLADKGTSNPAQSTLNLLNAGWSIQQAVTAIGPAGPVVVMPQHAVAVFSEVEPRLCNHPIDLLLELVTQDGQPVEVPGPAGPQIMSISQPITVVSPAGMPPGSPGLGNLLLEFSPLPIQPGGYEWRVTLAGEHLEHWAARFQVVPTPQPQVPIFGTPPPPAE
jgi:hypothetical protein